MTNLQSPKRSNIVSSNGLAATSHPLASDEAISILKQGGNAIDAAIAASNSKRKLIENKVLLIPWPLGLGP